MKQLAILITILATCSSSWSCSGSEKVAPKPELSTEQELRNLLFGSDQACKTDETCHGAVCDTGQCVGVLLASEPWLQKRIAAKVADRLRKDETLKNAAMTLLAAGLTQEHSNQAQKARTIPLLEELRVLPLLELLAQDKAKALATQAALALCRLGHKPVLSQCLALTENDDLTIATEAIDAIAKSGSSESLTVLLEILSPDLDRMLVRASLEALEMLKDPRSIRPLVRFLSESPDYLKDTTARTLRKVTNVRLGQSTQDWRAWVESNNPPSPPPHVLRSSNSTKILGIPEP